MIRFEEIENGFNIYFKNFKFFSHTVENPSFEIGIGSAKYKQHHSMFRIKGFIKKRFPLSEYNLLSKTDNQVILEFSHNDYSFVVEFFLKKDILLISLKCENALINRFWIRILANKDEAIFGCGEQFAELNLKGHKIPLWVEDASPASRMKHTYYPQPNFISSYKYFCHVKTNYYAEFDFTKEHQHELHIWSVPEEIYIGK